MPGPGEETVAGRPSEARPERRRYLTPRPADRFRRLLVSLCLWPSLAWSGGSAPVSCPQALAADIPPRPRDAAAGTRFAEQIAGSDTQARERAIEAELVRGNLPSFLRRLRPVTLSSRLPGGGTPEVTVCVMPDYLAVGSDADFLRIPMDLHTATAVASRFGFVLPTRKMVDAIHDQSDARLPPAPMRPGAEMRSTAYYVAHDSRITAQAAALGVTLGALISGQKKDVVMTSLLSRRPGRIAIYGWHRPDGRPIQPLSTVHGAGYADYSHGIRLVSDVVYVDGEASSIYEILEDPARAALLSDDGPVPDLAELIPRREARVERLARLLAPYPPGSSGPPGGEPPPGGRASDPGTPAAGYPGAPG